MALGKLIELTCCIGIILLHACDLLECRDCVLFSYVSVHEGRALIFRA